MAQRKLAADFARTSRDLWICLGIALLAFAILEVAFVSQRAIRSAWLGPDDARAADRDGHPYAGQSW